MAGIQEMRIAETPIAVIDLETTGLSAKFDRVVELSIFRVDPNESDRPKWMLDTLINPRRPVAATEIHGITDQDVRNAPTFAEIAADVRESVSGCVVASYNVSFDMGFLVEEFADIGHVFSVPYACLMYLRPGLGLGNRCTLASACATHGIQLHNAHAAATDGYASAQLVPLCRRAAVEQNYETFGDIAKKVKHKYTRSWGVDPVLPTNVGLHGPYKSRAGYARPKQEAKTSMASVLKASGSANIDALARMSEAKDARSAAAEYWDALTTVLSDAEVSDEEVGYLRNVRKTTGISAESAMFLHTRAFMGMLQQLTADQQVDKSDVELIRKVRAALHKAGYAPGD